MTWNSPRRPAALLFAVAVLSWPPAASLAADLGAYFAEALPTGGVRLMSRRAAALEDVDGEIQGAVWRELSLRGRARHEAIDGALIEHRGVLARLQVRGDYQLVAFRGGRDHPGASGLAMLRAGGVETLRWDPGDRYEVQDFGAFLDRDGRSLVLVLKGGEDSSGEILIVGIESARPVLESVRLPPEIRDLEPASACLTASACFVEGRSRDGDWSLLRALRPPAGSGEAPAIWQAEAVAGPFARVEPWLSIADAAVAFIAGAGRSEVDLWVAREAGAAVNVTGAPGRYIENGPGEEHFAISADGCRVAYNLLVGGEPEVFLEELCSPEPGERRQITADLFFNPYIDQESWVFFARDGDLVFSGGHDPVTLDFYRVPGGAPSETWNITQTGSETMPFTKGSLSFSAVVQGAGGVLALAASDLASGQDGALRVVSAATGELLPGAEGLRDPRGFLPLGEELYFAATGADGRARYLRLSAAGLETAAIAAPGAEPMVIYRGAARALVAVPGAAFLELRAGEAVRAVAPLDGLSAVSAASDGRFILYSTSLDASGAGIYRLLDAVTGEDRPAFTSAGALVSPAALSAERPFIRGDANGDGSLDISDAVRTLAYLFQAGSPLTCFDAADANDDGETTISDPVRSLLFLYAGGPPPPPPYPEPGADPSPDDLYCLGF
jgi:hypothetical protein